MRYRQFGRTGLFVSELALGTMTFGSQGFWQVVGQVDQAGSTRLVERALAAGINLIDTADIYHEGQSELILGQALRDLGVKRSDVVIATKCYGRMGRGPNDLGASRGHIMDSVAASLERLGLDHIDLYQIHAQDAVTPIEETVRALDDLVRQGMVRYVGCSNWQAWTLMKALGIAERHGWARMESVQSYYSIAGRDLEREVVPLLRSERVGLLVWSPLAGGLLSGKFAREGQDPVGARRAQFDFPPVERERAFACVDAMREIGTARGVSVARVALAYVLAKPWVTSVILGAKTLEQLDDNLGASGFDLTPEEVARLDAVSALPAEYPGWMLARQGGERIPK